MLLYSQAMLDLHRLRVFRSVVASGSVHAAAANLGYTPSAISQHLAALQRETGLTLLERSGRGLRPTSAGRTLAAEADEVLARVGAAEALVADLRSGRTGSLSIVYFPSAGIVWMPALVDGLLRAYPGVRLDLRLSDEPPERLEERPDLQLFVAGDEIPARPGFITRHLRDDPYVAVLPDPHPLAGRAEIELAELEQERWIDYDAVQGRCRQIGLDACAAVGFRPAFRVEAHDCRSALAFVAAGIGVTMMPSLGAEQPPPGVTVVPVVRPTPVRSIHVVIRESIVGTGPGRAAVELLLADRHPAASGGPDLAYG
ncbi:DNA-binding transcriptional regulator, LysR family [Actinoplanes regularis]|uniref:DNA-binding transcriptional regulator, LysR family n=2 Tax=Actinoplanes regularis TaxID=52697 RepID=A0A239CSZ7_9ACTN|nr:LysR family transcriptional regulator [Actinoplanes regularis]SNS22781.1 DNA-binding transcriptional regulator, LysR family [Actinoplanes regularis]